MAKPMKTLELYYPLDSGDLSGGGRYPPFQQILPGPFSVAQLCAYGRGTLFRKRSVAGQIESHNLYSYSFNDKLLPEWGGGGGDSQDKLCGFVPL